jgi:hypothetical protein
VWILGTVLGVFLFLLLLLAVPVDVVFSVEKDTDFRTRVRVGWMFGLIGRDIGAGKKPGKKREAEKKKGRRSIRPLIAIVRTRGFVPRASRFLRSALRLMKVRELTIDFRVGLDSPADTGMLFAALAPATAFAQFFTPLDIRLTPDFTEEILEGRARGDLRVVPLVLLALAVRFALSLTTLRAVRAMRAARRR